MNEWLDIHGRGDHWGRADIASDIAAFVIALQKSPVRVANIYDARCQTGPYSPLFNPLTFKPSKAFYALKAFGELYGLGTEVAVSGGDGTNGLWAVAAKGKGAAAVLVANYSKLPCELKVDFGARRILSCALTDGERTEAACDLPTGLPPYSFLLVRLSGPACDLTAERRTDPVGIDAPKPRLGWKLPAGVLRQNAYEIEADGWTSGKVASDRQVDVAWGGRKLKSA